MGSYGQSISELSLDAAKAAAILSKFIEGEEFFRVVTHLDADGITAAGIIGNALDRAGATFRIRVVKEVDRKLIEELKQEEPTPLVFTDLGGGSLELLKALGDREIVVLDHHQPAGEAFPRLCLVNPHIRNIDGAREISAAGVCYLVAKALDGSNIDLAALAVVGALGDSQDRYDGRSLGGVNEGFVRDAAESSRLKVETDLLFYGRETRPIHKAISYTVNPYIPGLSGEEDKCLAFVTNIGISVKKQDRWRSLSDLSSEEKQLLFSSLVKYLAAQGLPSRIAMSLIGKVYTLVLEERLTPLRDGREFASLLNACGRMGKSGVGVSIALGDRAVALEEAQKIVVEYRKALSGYMDWLSKSQGSLQNLQNVYVINGEGVIDELMLSTVASVATSSGLFGEARPIIALTKTREGSVKISGRLPEGLRSRLNLGNIFREAAERLNGIGGGHDVAAGARMQDGQEEEFLRLVDEAVGRLLDQMNNSRQ